MLDRCVQLFKLCRPAVVLYSALPGGHKYISNMEKATGLASHRDFFP
jgi:hypothetical protein